MNNILIVIILAAVLLALAFAGIAVKMLVRRGGEFKRHCSSTDPYTGKNAGCVCGKPQQSPCHEQKRHTPLEVNDELLREC